ncbi:MAG: urea ABC transporter permease subunit UrtB [Spirochaetales bacterium]|nr:urea ABC transporter permease subunit UrtB [Spirochaetales bacterium]
MDTFVMQLFNGLSLSSILLLVGLGLSITFGIMGIINFAHGEFMMFGAYSVYLVQNLTYGLWGDFFFIFAIPASFFIAAGLGFLLERSIIRHLYNRPYESILVTWGLSLIFQQASRNIFGASNVDVRSPDWLKGGISISDTIQFPYNRIFIILIAIIAIAVMYFYIYKTTNGLKMRAVMQNRAMGASMGIQTRKVDSLTFAIGCGLAGLAGCVVSLLGSIGPSTGQNYIVDAFMVVVMGGVGSLAGTIAGALMMGIISPLLEFFTTSSMGKVLVFIVVILFLQLKPKGFVTFKSRALD